MISSSDPFVDLITEQLEHLGTQPRTPEGLCMMAGWYALLAGTLKNPAYAQIAQQLLMEALTRYPPAV